jgi:hypothetical protein
MFAGFERRLNLFQMQIGRSADIENIDIRPAAYSFEALSDFLDSVFFGYRGSALEVNVTKDFDVEKVTEFLKSRDM